MPWDSFVNKDQTLGSLVISSLVFFSYIIILNTVVPISLYVSVEFIRSIQSLWINWDAKMYYAKADIQARARTTTLNEELGQIEYIFSDKTGTLTQNIMTFNKCSINGRLYGYVYNAQGDELDVSTVAPVDFSANPYHEATFRFYDRSLLDAIESGDVHCCRFFTLLCVCHTVMAEEKEPGALTYQAQSPDEGALVSAARNFGFVFHSRTPKTITVLIGGQRRTFDVLNILDFNNDRKRMSVIVRDMDAGGRLVLYCKGADTVVKERLTAASAAQFEAVEEAHLTKFAEDALRTLCLAWRELSDDEYAAWSRDHHEASTSLVDRAAKVSAVYELIERDLLFIGSTAIEDKLQEGVAECIAKLSKANIKIWVLTGDKLDTAINIGYSCQLLTNDMDVYAVEATDELQLREQIRDKRRLIDINIARLKALQQQEQQQQEKQEQQQQQQQSSTPLRGKGGGGVAQLNQSFLSTNSINMSLSPPASSAPSSRPDSSGIFSNYSAATNGIGNGNVKVADVEAPATGGSALVINGQSLVYALKPAMEKEFLDLACMCKSVICCRVTPGQKKAVVDLVKKHKKAITLAIGDGANDVSMIKGI